MQPMKTYLVNFSEVVEVVVEVVLSLILEEVEEVDSNNNKEETYLIKVMYMNSIWEVYRSFLDDKRYGQSFFINQTKNNLLS
jgi:hypothetical protein